tara:strand:- start:1352 stop:1621 length:270 start_codon:yes stop_codon:yes gene_type:complete
MRAQTKTTTDFKDKAIWHEVTMVQEYTRTVQILAIDVTEANEIAKNRARVAKAIPRLGYSLGDVDIIETKHLKNYSRHHKNKRKSTNHG